MVSVTVDGHCIAICVFEKIRTEQVSVSNATPHCQLSNKLRCLDVNVLIAAAPVSIVLRIDPARELKVAFVAEDDEWMRVFVCTHHPREL